MHPRRVRIDHLPPEGDTFDLRLDADSVEALLRERSVPDSLEAGNVTARMRVIPGGDDVFLLGEMQGQVTGTCSRCLETCEQPLAGEFHLTFVADAVAGQGGETELHREDMDLERLRDREIDLAEVLAEQICLRLSSHPLCSDECRGLCPVCGENRNRVTCACERPAPDPRFAALAALRGVGTESKD